LRHTIPTTIYHEASWALTSSIHDDFVVSANYFWDAFGVEAILSVSIFACALCVEDYLVGTAYRLSDAEVGVDLDEPSPANTRTTSPDHVGSTWWDLGTQIVESIKPIYALTCSVH
jgi:hypothetical protein